MKWFGRKSGREGARLPLARSGGGGSIGIGEWPRSYEAQVREAYCHNPVAQRAVKLVSEAVGSAPLKASDPALAALVTARSGGQVLIESVAAQLLLHGQALATFDLPAQATGTVARALAQGVSDEEPAEAQAQILGVSLVPPAPVHLRARARPDGATEILWVRRSRNGWDWIDGVDAPLGEESERYQLTLTLVAGGVRTIETDAPTLVLSAEERLATGAIAIRQIGAHGLSPPAMLELGEG